MTDHEDAGALRCGCVGSGDKGTPPGWHRMSSATHQQSRDPNRWMVLLACIMAVLTVVIDSGLLNLITPAIQKEFDAPSPVIGLLASISTLMLAAFTLGGGTLGDLYGRRRFILIGTTGMMVAAVLSVLTPNAQILIAIRGLDGIFEALVSPLALAIITVTFDREERPRALGIYGAVLGIMGGLSSLIAQALNQAFGWRSTFTLTIALGILTILLMLRFVRESRSEQSQNPDGIGIGLCAAGLLALVYGISQTSGAGGILSAAVLRPAGLGLILLAGFVGWEARVKQPALQLTLFRQPAFTLGTLLVMVFSLTQTSVYFHLSNYIQLLLQRSPLQAALMLLPLTLSIFFFSILAGPLAKRFKDRSLIMFGIALAAVALFLLMQAIHPNLSLVTLALPLMMMGAGMAIANIPRMNALLSSAPPAMAGTASATNNAAMQLGNAMGVAVSVALVTSFGRSRYFADLETRGLTADQIRQASGLLRKLLSSDIPSIASQYAIAPRQLEGLLGNYQAAFTAGVSLMIGTLMVLLSISAIIVWFGLRPGLRSS